MKRDRSEKQEHRIETAVHRMVVTTSRTVSVRAWLEYCCQLGYQHNCEIHAVVDGFTAIFLRPSEVALGMTSERRVDSQMIAYKRWQQYDELQKKAV
jgi:hypothetical protein